MSNHGDARLLQWLLQHALELARAHPGLAHALALHHLHHRLGLLHARGLALAALVVRLATHAHVSASLAHTQSLDESLLQGLPEGFFTMRTP